MLTLLFLVQHLQGMGRSIPDPLKRIVRCSSECIYCACVTESSQHLGSPEPDTIIVIPQTPEMLLQQPKPQTRT